MSRPEDTPAGRLEANPGGEQAESAGATGAAETAESSETAESRRPAAEAGLPVPPPNVRDPWKGLRGVMAGTLVLESIVFALALLVVSGGIVVTAVAVLAVLMLLAAFVQRRRWGLGAALALQVVAVACLVVSLAVGAMGVVFAAIWGYILYVRRDVAKRMREGLLADQLGHPPGYPPAE